MLEAAAPSVQWAAVSTWVEEIRVPPHQGVRPFLLTSPTWRLCLQSVLVEDIFKTDLPWVFVLLSLLATNNTAVGSATLHSALERQASVKNDGCSSQDVQYVQDVQDIQYVQDVQDIQDVQDVQDVETWQVPGAAVTTGPGAAVVTGAAGVVATVSEKKSMDF